MKRILAFLCAVLMLASCAYADETAEITYQGIPWGSSVETVMEWLKNQGFRGIHNSSGGIYHLDAEGKCTYKLMEGMKFVSAQSNTTFQYQVAGYDVSQLHFSFDIVDGEPALATVAVIIGVLSIDQTKQVLDDLEQKLIQVYGENECEDEDEPAAEESNSEADIYAALLAIIAASDSASRYSPERYIKHGANNTAVCLTKSTGVMIVYGKTDAFADLEQPAVTASPFDLSGL